MQTKNEPSWVEGLSQADGEACLSNLHQLADELDIAMNAIVQRDLGSLHDSLFLQEASCARLTELRHRSIAKPEGFAELEAGRLDADLALAIESAKNSLVILNSRYAALLNHSGETLRLLAGLYRSYRNFARSASGVPSSIPTWSCEV